MNHPDGKPGTGDPAGLPDLSVIVPVHNAERHLPDLVQSVFGLEAAGLNCEMICVDDGSDDDSVTILRDLATRYPDLSVIEGTENRGAGIARNQGWARARGRYSIFFDADDILHGDVVADAIRDLDADPETDVAMFAYRYEREETASFTAMGHEDQNILDHVLQGAPTATGTIDTMAQLLIFTNYPWNKIIRTARFRQTGMRFGRTRVNNDILGHWHSLLLARGIMLRDSIICTHVVHPGGTNITNRSGLDRLQMFDALEETYHFLESHPHLRRRFAHFFWRLASRLSDWAQARLDPAFTMQFDERRSDLVQRIDLGDLARMRSGRAPELATALADRLLR